MGQRTAFLDVQKAVYAALTGDATLTAMVQGIWDDVPEGTDFPYVAIGEAIETPDNTFGHTGRSVLSKVVIYSRAKGFTEAANILEEVTRVLDETQLVVAGGWTANMSQLELAETLREPDGQTRHIVASYRVGVER